MSVMLAPIRLREIFRIGRVREASDLHLHAGSAPVLRVDGRLENGDGPPMSREDLELLVESLLDDYSRSIFAGRGDVTSTYRDADLGSFRVHAYRSAGGPALAVRVLAQSIPALGELQLPAAVARLAESSSGLVLFTGPTGSGKSTALAAIVDRINRTQHRHILTVEDPIEYVYGAGLSIVSQREVPRDVPDFAAAIYGALRSDPDVLAIGELRDRSTMHAALTAAETGHLIFATLHTGEAAQTIDRIISAFEGESQDQVRIQLAQTLVAVVCLRLLPRACGTGRRAAAEVLLATDAVRSLIRDGKTHQLRNVMATSRSAGMQTLESHLGELIADREVDVECAKRATARAGELRLSNEGPAR